MTDLLIILLPYLLRFLKDPWNNKRLAPLAMVGAVADVSMNNFTVPIFIGGGWWQEWTFSQRLERLCAPENSQHPDFYLFVEIGLKINREAGYPHIQVLKDYKR